MKFTIHAKQRAAERGITKEMISEAVANPSLSFYDLCSSANVVFRRLDGKHLLVVYTSDNKDIRVITTFITSVAQEIISNKLDHNIWVKIK